MKIKTINLVLRGITLGSKFLLSIYLVKFLSLEANGEYGIFVATISMLTYVLGLDFYSFNNREILQENSSESGKKIKNQFFLFTIVYLIVLPLLYVLGLFDFIGEKYVFLFYLILIFDHISIELYRLLVVFSKPIQANMNLFLRTGIWILVLIFAWHNDFEELKNLKSVFNFWMIGSFLSVAYSIFSLSTTGISIPWREKIETKWILAGLKIATPFFIATLSYKIIQFADRYMVEFYLGTKQTGVYYFFSNISMLIETFVQTTVVMIYSPQLIASLKKDKPFQINIFKTFSKEIVIYSVLAVVSVCAIIYPLLYIVEKTELFLSISVFFVMVTTRFIFNISLIYHFKLYVAKKDRIIMTSTLVAVLFNISLNFIFIPYYGLIGGALATLVSILIMMGFKLFYAKKYEH
ncbi:MAG: polysaccharide biosynthesis C-terminal domain-containing protein [Bacteroidota bacterium]|nr:polysaccharide biosynthesis C-terminal domain-containing protein [Bacteroidota bacterium]